MTTDIEQAARAERETLARLIAGDDEWWEQEWTDHSYYLETADSIIAAGFRSSEYLLSNENVAPIARALYVAQMAGADEEPDWENETGYVHDGFMADARAALSAVLGKEPS